MSSVVYLSTDNRIIAVTNERLARLISTNLFNQFGVKSGYTISSVNDTSYQYTLSLESRCNKQTREQVKYYAMGFAQCFDVS